MVQHNISISKINLLEKYFIRKIELTLNRRFLHALDTRSVIVSADRGRTTEIIAILNYKALYDTTITCVCRAQVNVVADGITLLPAVCG